LSRYGQRYAAAKEHEFCLGEGPVTGGIQLHALLRAVAPEGVSGPWCQRSLLTKRGRKSYLSIRSFYQDNLLDAVLRWDEPVLEQHS
jgi:hypothetical protein